MKKIYCISGLGADKNIFSRIDVPGCTLEHLHWLPPEKNEPIEAYAKRMALQIKDESPVLMGVSFGGMMCIEIAKLIPVEKVILVSSIDSYMQLPQWMRVAGKLKLNRMLPMRSYTALLQPVQDYHIGAKTPEEKVMVRRYRKTVPQEYLDWAVNAVINWKNEWQPAQLYHIHGDADKIFPLKKVKPSCVIKGGTHFMIYSQAKEVSDYLERVINRQQGH